MMLSFALVQVAAIAIGAQFVSEEVSIVENSADVSNSLYFLAYIIAAAAVFLLILHFYKGSKLFYLLELVLIFASVQIAVSAFNGEIHSDTPVQSTTIGLLAAFCRAILPQSKNAFLMLAAASVGAVLGSSLDIFPALLLAAGLAAYDYIAVFKTKHMVTLAKELGDREAGFSISFGNIPKNAKLIKTQKGLKSKKGTLYPMIELGTGDLVIPAMLCVSALKLGAAPNFAAAIAGALGAMVGFWVLMKVLESKRGFLPALPPIVFFTLLGIGFEYLFEFLQG